MYQTWDKLLFMHWSIGADRLRALVPRPLSIDTFDGRAWIGVTPFTMPRIRLPWVPALPFVSRSHEINVRTYVHYEGVPGVWFFSLDADNALAVVGARLGFHLPYFHARMSLEADRENVTFTSRRRHAGAPGADFSARWSGGDRLKEAEVGSLDFFLTERYCLYAVRGRSLYRAPIHHPPWLLRAANVQSYSSSMIESHGLPTPEGEPLLHGQASPLDVEIWPLRKVGRVASAEPGG